MLAFAVGVGMITSALMVSYRDIREVTPVAVQMLLYISPVAYSVEAIPEQYVDIFALNPLVGVLEGFRWSLLSTAPPGLGRVAYSVAAAIGILLVGAFTFARLERRFADVI
jgi:lipopolysaccharide transport system permease protein